jgi:tripartite-type tricarboxylate transporter receptor subunit TctC
MRSIEQDVIVNAPRYPRFARCAAGLIAVTLAAGVGAAQAQSAASFPSRNITLIVPFAAGGPPDAVARVVAAELGKTLGKPVIVENRPGASTALAAAAVARAAPDGHTLMAVDISFAVTPFIAANLGIDPLKDFKVVGQSAKSIFTMIASQSLGAPSVNDFVKRARDKPDTMKIGHTGVGTTPHLAAITFMRATGIDPLLVPYRALADATTNVVGGHISAVFSAASTAINLAKDGKVNVLGVTGHARANVLPDVPTFAENGIRMTGFEDGIWYGIVAPAATPDDIVAKLNDALNQAVADKGARERLAAAGLELTGGTPQAFRDFIAAQHAYWGETLRAAGVKPE